MAVSLVFFDLQRTFNIYLLNLNCIKCVSLQKFYQLLFFIATNEKKTTILLAADSHNDNSGSGTDTGPYKV